MRECKQEDKPWDEVVESEGEGAELEIEESRGFETRESRGWGSGWRHLTLKWEFVSSLGDLGFWDGKK